jgi:hypothetical protein
MLSAPGAVHPLALAARVCGSTGPTRQPHRGRGGADRPVLAVGESSDEGVTTTVTYNVQRVQRCSWHGLVCSGRSSPSHMAERQRCSPVASHSRPRGARGEAQRLHGARLVRLRARKGGTMRKDGSSSQPRAPARHGGAPVRDFGRPEPYHGEQRQAPAAQG